MGGIGSLGLTGHTVCAVKGAADRPRLTARGALLDAPRGPDGKEGQTQGRQVQGWLIHVAVQ